LGGVASRRALCDNIIAMIARALTIAGSDSGGGAGIVRLRACMDSEVRVLVRHALSGL